MTQQDTRPSVGEQLELLTGYDEAKIVAKFGHPPLSGEDEPGLTGTMQMRALVFAHEMHTGVPDAEAYATSMQMTIKEVNGYFADEADDAEADDLDLGEPVTEQGKDAEPEV